MKNIIFILSILFFASAANYGQGHMHRFKDAEEKINQLEKLKLIEILNMDEETSVRFFTRRQEFLNRIDDLHNNAMKQIARLDSASGNENISDEQLEKMINEHLTTEQKIVKTRAEFLNSLSDILSYKQIAKIVVFEKKFREEMRDILFKQRFPKEHQ